jgi:hypothetical protein
MLFGPLPLRQSTSVRVVARASSTAGILVTAHQCRIHLVWIMKIQLDGTWATDEAQNPFGV